MSAELIVRTQLSDGSFDCERYLDFPGKMSAFIVICFVDSVESERQAYILKNKLIENLSNLSISFRQDTPICGGRINMSLLDCPIKGAPNFTRLLIIVSDGTTNVFTNHDIVNWDDLVLPVYKRGHHFKLPSPFDRPNASFWDLSISEIIPAILSKITVIDEDFSIFISYKRSETSEFAEQLHDHLIHEGFEVFLDRFSIEPGVNFQERLYQELSDKAIIILLESKDYLKSQWIKYEVAFAKKYKLGIIAINQNGARKALDIDEEYRYDLKSEDFEVDKKIKKDKLLDLIAFIKENHAKAIYRKRYYLQQNIIRGLQKESVTSVVDMHGFIEVADLNNQKLYKIWSTVRPPTLKDFHFSDATWPDEEKIIFGPKFIEGKRESYNNWLTIKTEISFFSEPEINKMCKAIVRGKI
jgi:hypothetical protein